MLHFLLNFLVIYLRRGVAQLKEAVRHFITDIRVKDVLFGMAVVAVLVNTTVVRIS